MRAAALESIGMMVHAATGLPSAQVLVKGIRMRIVILGEDLSAASRRAMIEETRVAQPHARIVAFLAEPQPVEGPHPDCWMLESGLRPFVRAVLEDRSRVSSSELDK